MEIDTIVCGDCLKVLSTIPDRSVDAVITDPPYPHIKRDYGYWTVEEWWALIVEGVIPEVRRILKPTGSAVFILQPNSEKVGKMRGWLWEFMAWVCREWNLVQDAYWWNISAVPNVFCQERYGLMRTAVKIFTWVGPSNCYRNQQAILWDEAIASKTRKLSARAVRKFQPSGYSVNRVNSGAKADQRGGVTPFNILPFGTYDTDGNGHGARTPIEIADWWTRYIVPPGGVSVDPFVGSGTMPVAAVKNRCHFFGCDTVQEYVDISNERIAKARLEMAQLPLDITPERGEP